jgi:hypothetical protein
MELVLKRTYYPSGTNGTIYMDGVKICHSIELPWLDNKPQRSCIPEGKYELKKRWSPKYGHHYWLQDVPGRAFILIHPANNAKKELHGCIAPVLYLAGEGRGSYSRMALKALQALIDEVIGREKVFISIQSQPSLQAQRSNIPKNVFWQETARCRARTTHRVAQGDKA